MDNIMQWVLMLALSAGAAWGGAKYAIGSHEKRLNKHDLDIEKNRADIGAMTSKVTTEKIQDALKDFVPVITCRDKQIACYQSQQNYDSETSKKLDLLFAKIDDMEKGREKQKDERNKIIANLAMQIAVLDNTINQRSRSYRSNNGNPMPLSPEELTS